MFSNIISALGALVIISSQSAVPVNRTLAEHKYSLANRYPNNFVNKVMEDNILLSLFYMRGFPKTVNPDWNYIEKPFTYSLSLNPGEQFAFHDDLLPKYQGIKTKTTNSHFNAQEGFKSDGYLFGDGVCHFASFINFVARKAGLKVESPTPHDFARIPEIDKEFGVAIYASPEKNTGSELQNLYIQNNKEKQVKLVFVYKENALDISVVE